jgi:predicted nucleotidyltransferase
MIPEIERCRTDLEALSKRFGVHRLEAFGSAVTGRFQTATSDIDFLVEFQPPNGPGYADRYFGLLESLEALFQRPVDLVVTSAIRNPYFRQAVDETRTLLYAA